VTIDEWIYFLLITYSYHQLTVAMTVLQKKVLFIVNPISGDGRQEKTVALLKKSLDVSKFSYEIVFTEMAGHAAELSKQAAAAGAYIVVAVGGDGTVNEVAQGLVGTDTVLGIIPKGSGNGLSRHLKIPMNLKQAIGIINTGKVVKIDTATLNDDLFVSVAGVGFDASVAKKFARAGKRGFLTYVKITAGSYHSYKARKYSLNIDGNVIERKALLISFANSSQFGNNTSIDPGASIDDGFIDVCIVQRIPLWKTLLVAPLLFIKKFDRTPFIEIIRAREVQVTRKKGKSIHLDGDPKKISKEFTVKINPSSLNVLVP
jgi:diacylglycerol kinase (ATP)